MTTRPHQHAATSPEERPVEHAVHTSSVGRGPFLPPVWFGECADERCRFRERADSARDARLRSEQHVANQSPATTEETDSAR